MKALDPVRVEFLQHRSWKVLERIRYYDAKTRIIQHTVPAGFVTDFASIPRGLWNIFPPTGPYAPAAVLHDFMYVRAWGTKAEADKIFRKSMKQLGVPYWKRWSMWAAVRIGGKGNYE